MRNRWTSQIWNERSNNLTRFCFFYSIPFKRVGDEESGNYRYYNFDHSVIGMLLFLHEYNLYKKTIKRDVQGRIY